MVKPGKTEPAAALAADDLLEAFKEGDTIYEAGSRGEARMFVIEEGTIEIFQQLAGTTRRRAKLDRGDFFGEGSLLEDRPRQNSARALSDCRLLPIDASNFDEMLRRYPEIAIRMLRALSRRLSDYEEAEKRAAAIVATSKKSEEMPVVAASQEHEEEPAVAKTGATVARLVHSSGAEYPIQGDSVTQIGRTDPVTCIAPDIDLDSLDRKQTLSRRHARITARGKRFILCEHIGTANGTFVGSRRLKAGEEHEIKDGDKLRFGLLDFVFRIADS